MSMFFFLRAVSIETKTLLGLPSIGIDLKDSADSDNFYIFFRCVLSTLHIRIYGYGYGTGGSDVEMFEILPSD